MGKKVSKKKKAGAARGAKKASSAKGGKGAKRVSPVFPVTTGKGPGPAEIGALLVEHVRSGKPDVELWDAVFDKSFVSVEGHGVGMGWLGRRAVEAKCAEWVERNEVLSAEVDGPYLGSSGFAVRYSMRVKDRASGAEQTMNEVGVYTVQNGKVVREEFMYGG